MMSATHGPSGTLSGLLVLLAGKAATVTPDTPIAIAFVAGATAGALLPDADHHSSSPARVWGPVTSIPCGWLGKAAGGHRAATHDISKGAPILFALVFGLGLLAPLLTLGPPWMDTTARMAGMAVVALIAGLVFVGIADLIPGRWQKEAPLNFAASWLVAAMVTQPYPTGLPWQVIVAAVAGIALGVLTGIAGDACTLSGVPWRGRKGRDSVHLLPEGWRIRTGSTAEVHLVRYPIIVGIGLSCVYLLA